MRYFGFVTVNAGTKIHRKRCPNAAQLHEKYPYRIVKARWTSAEKTKNFLADIRILGIDKQGMLNSISKVISKDASLNVRSVSLNSKDGLFKGQISIYVNSINHLKDLIRNLHKIKGVMQVDRNN